LRCIPAIISFLNPQSALNLVGGNRSSCPFADPCGRRIDASGILGGQRRQHRVQSINERRLPVVVITLDGVGRAFSTRSIARSTAGLLPRLARDDQNFLPLPLIRPERATISSENRLKVVALDAGLSAPEANYSWAAICAAGEVHTVTLSIGTRLPTADQASPETAAKAKVFISYSRVDRGFAVDVVAELKERGFEALIDLDDILPTEAWWARIRDLIVRADAMVFVISPQAVASPVCRDEIAFACSLNKRLMPILWRTPGDIPMPTELSELNWILF
jgi:hypothetical protein